MGVRDAKFIGKEEELAILGRAYTSVEAEMVAVTGRRRMGKTYLVRKAYEGRIASSSRFDLKPASILVVLSCAGKISYAGSTYRTTSLLSPILTKQGLRPKLFPLVPPVISALISFQ